MKNCILINILFLVFINSSLISQINQKKEKIKKDINQIIGFGDLDWGINFSDAKKKVIGKITFYDEMRLIVTRDGDIEYLYGFFYIEPSNNETEKKDIKLKDEKIKEPSQEVIEAKLFYVSLQFPYLAMNDVRKKVEKKYGPATGEVIKNNQGAIIWDFERTKIIIWIERYENHPFCRKINYISKDLATKINEYQEQIFNKLERDILKKLSI